DVYGAFGRDFVTADGRRVMVVAISERQWASLVDATRTQEGMAAISAARGLDLSDEGDRYGARDAIAALLEPWFAARSLAAVREALDAHGVCWGPYQTFSELVTGDPRVVDNPLFARVEHPGVGAYLTPGSPIRSTTESAVPPGPAPRLGTHTDE